LTDLFSEIEQDLRRERANKLWEKYGIYLIGLAVAIVVIASAVVGWRAWQTSRAEAASTAYDAVLAEAAKQKPEEAAAALGAFADGATSAYATLAHVQQGAYLLQAGDKAGAIAAYDKAAAEAKGSPVMQGMAQIKAALLLVDTATYDEMNARLGSLDEAGAPWRNNARELLGMSAYKAGKFAEAETSFAAIIADRTATPGLRDRAHVMQALIAPHLPKPAAAEDKTSEKVEAPAQAAPETKAE
jgi:hypothetical protein